MTVTLAKSCAKYNNVLKQGWQQQHQHQDLKTRPARKFYLFILFYYTNMSWLICNAMEQLRVQPTLSPTATHWIPPMLALPSTPTNHTRKSLEISTPFTLTFSDFASLPATRNDISSRCRPGSKLLQVSLAYSHETTYWFFLIVYGISFELPVVLIFLLS